MRPVLVALCILLLPHTARAQTISFLSAPNLVGSGLQSADARARLSDTQHGGVTVTVAVSDSTQALIAPDDSTPGEPSIDVFVPNGQRDAFFVVQALPDTTGMVTVEVQAPGFASNSFAVDVVPPAIELLGVTAINSVIDPEDAFIVRVGVPESDGSRLDFAQSARVGGPGITATVTSSAPSVLTLRTLTQSGGSVTVFVPPGENASASNVNAGGVAVDGLAPGVGTIAVTADGFDPVDTATADVTMEAASLALIGVPSTVGAGLRSGLLRARLSGSDHGGTTIAIASGDPSRALLAPGANDAGVGVLNVFVPNGSIDAFFYAHGLENVAGIVSIDASAPGIVGDNDAITVAVPDFRLNSVAGSLDTLDPPDAFTVQVGLSSNGTNWTSSQAARPGGPGIDGVAFANDPSVIQIVDASASGDTLAFRIEPGNTSSASSISQGGVGIDGVAAGTTVVTAAIDGFTPTTAAFRTVEVTQPTIVLSGTTIDLGSGLQSNALRARLSASEHGGVTVSIGVDDATLALVASNEMNVGAASVDVFVPDGQTDAIFYVNALEARTGDLLLDATAPGFSATTAVMEIVDPRIEIRTSTLRTTVTTLDDSDPFSARIGWLAGSNFNEQPLRPGSPGLTLTFDVSAPAVGDLFTETATGAPIAITLAAGEGATPSTLALGGVAFDPMGAGTVDVSVSAPGFVPGPNATRTVNVSLPDLTVQGVTTDLGAGLQSNNLSVRLDSGNHGGVTVRIESADPSLVLVAPDDATPGGAFVDVFVADGSITAPFILQALDGLTGSSVITATCSGFVSASDVADVVQPGVEIEFLDQATDVMAPDDPFVVRVGVPSANGSALSYRLDRRAGAGPLAVTLVSNDAAVGELVTLSSVGPLATVFVAEGAQQTPTTVGAGGAAFRAIGSGSTIVSATSPGFFQTGEATREVVVDEADLALVAMPARLGAGLTGGPVLARLGSIGHGGTLVTIASEDTTRVLVTTDPTVPASTSIDVLVANAQTDATFFVVGVEGGSGAASVAASAPGFGSVSRATEVVAPALQIVDLPDSSDVNVPDLGFRVQVGIAEAAGVGLAQLQTVRAGTALEVTAAKDVDGLGDLVTALAFGDTVSVTIPAGSAETAATVGTGGVAYDPRAPGTVTIGVTAPGAATIDRSVAVLTLTGTAVSVGDAPRWRFEVAGVHPNPFNPSTVVSFALDRSQRVVVQVVNVAGRIVRTLVREELVAGPHVVRWDGTDDRGARVASGVYLAVLRGEDAESSRKMVMVQ